MGHGACTGSCRFRRRPLRAGLGEAANFPAAYQGRRRVVSRTERCVRDGTSSTPAATSARLSPRSWCRGSRSATGGGSRSSPLAPWACSGLRSGGRWTATRTRIRGSAVGARRSRQSRHGGARGESGLGLLLRYRQMWAFAIAKFLTDPIRRRTLGYWVPDFLNRNHGIDLQHVGPPLVTIYLVADVGSIGGGVALVRAARAGLERERQPQDRHAGYARCSWCRLVFAAQVSSLWGAVAIVSLAAAAHQGWSASLFVRRPPTCSALDDWHGGRYRGHGGRHRRHADREDHRRRAADDGQLSRRVPDRRDVVSRRARHPAPARAVACARRRRAARAPGVTMRRLPTAGRSGRIPGSRSSRLRACAAAGQNGRWPASTAVSGWWPRRGLRQPRPSTRSRASGSQEQTMCCSWPCCRLTTRPHSGAGSPGCRRARSAWRRRRAGRPARPRHARARAGGARCRRPHRPGVRPAVHPRDDAHEPHAAARCWPTRRGAASRPDGGARRAPTPTT